tara:strand:+ start:661 stop:1698 length:1038 start_codon:yes stop_codon:yes gene_type:complete
MAAYTTIDKPSDYFTPKLYAGNDTGQSITMDFAPNWVWIKDRSGTDPHGVYDSVRGALKQLRMNLDNAERELAGSLTAFNSDGFTVGNDDGTNDNAHNFVSWNWRAGTSFSNDASSTSVGSIDSSGSVNTDAGFSIITYVGTGSAETIAHGLGATPGFIITRRIDGADSWMTYNKSFSAAQYMYINGDGAIYSASSVFGTLPTSTVYSTGGGTATGASGGNFISYCFAEKQGYSKFGSYKATEDIDGTSIYTGFSPAWVMIKQSNLARDWYIYDSERNTSNPVTQEINANNNGTEDTVVSIDFLANGFQIKTTGASLNDAGGTYIYWAFAKQPLVTSTGVPATAR